MWWSWQTTPPATWSALPLPDYLLPIHQEITAQVGGPMILHVCGNCLDRLEFFAESGVDAYHSNGR